VENFNLPDYILYPSEKREELAALVEELGTAYSPADELEYEVFEQLVIASWLRRRYETVRANLYDTKHAIEQNEPKSHRLPSIFESIQRFQLEIDRQKKTISACRRAFRRFNEEAHSELAPAA